MRHQLSCVTRVLICLSGLSLWSAAVQAAPAELLRDHPLAGTLWHVGESRQVTTSELFDAVAKARWVLLGEKHDNAAHHLIQSGIVAAMGQQGRRPAVVWEMAEPEHDPALKAARLETLADLGPAIAWEKRGWPSWLEYQPIAVQALTYGMTMAAGDAPPQIRRTIGKGGELDSDTAGRIGWARAYAEDQRRDLTELLVQSHCGTLPEAALPGMANVQRLRDAWIAGVMKDEGGRDGAILIAGAQHIRKDRGVPWHLGEAVVTVSAVEVARGAEDPADYPSFDPALFDFIWFTARVDEKDPCEGFRRKKE